MYLFTKTAYNLMIISINTITIITFISQIKIYKIILTIYAYRLTGTFFTILMTI